MQETNLCTMKSKHLQLRLFALVLASSCWQLLRTSLVAGSRFLDLLPPSLVAFFVQVRSTHPSSHHLPSLTLHAPYSTSENIAPALFPLIPLRCVHANCTRREIDNVRTNCNGNCPCGLCSIKILSFAGDRHIVGSISVHLTTTPH